MLSFKEKIRLIRIAACIIGCHLVMGIFQEKILKHPYGEEKEKFELAFAYVGVQCISYALIAKIAILLVKEEKNEVSQKYFALPAIFYVLAMVCSNKALKYVPYPTQVVAKSCKPIAVMLLGILIGRKNYTIKKFLIVILIVIGVIIFSWKEKATDNESQYQIIGLSLILASLLMDGFMGATQDRMRSVKKPTSLNLMYYINAWSSLYLVALLIFSMEGLEFIKFSMRHPRVIFDLSIVVFVGTFAQYFIADMIKSFGALPLSIALTIRKFITVFLSCIIYGNILMPRQWGAASIIFIALLTDALMSKSKEKDEKVENVEVQELPEKTTTNVEEADKMIQK